MRRSIPPGFNVKWSWARKFTGAEAAAVSRKTSADHAGMLGGSDFLRRVFSPPTMMENMPCGRPFSACCTYLAQRNAHPSDCARARKRWGGVRLPPSSRRFQWLRHGPVDIRESRDDRNLGANEGPGHANTSQESNDQPRTRRLSVVAVYGADGLLSLRLVSRRVCQESAESSWKQTDSDCVQPDR